MAVRYEILIRLLALNYDQLRDLVFRPTEGVLISAEISGDSRHNAGFALRARHPIIASIIFATAAPNDDAKFEILNSLLNELDPGYLEDRRMLEEIVRRRELVNTFASYDKRRAIYDRLAAILPDNPYVFQHRSILERELGNPDGAVRFAREALKLAPQNSALQNTLGLALEFSARPAFTNDPLRRQALISEASKIFDDGIRRSPTDPYNYVGKAHILKQSIDREDKTEAKTLLRANALSLLEEAYEVTGESPIIANELALHRMQLGNRDQAIAVLRAGLGKAPTNNRLRDFLVRLEVEAGRDEDALRVALEGEKFDPTSWRMQGHIARIERRLGHPVQAVKGHYEAAIRHHKGDVALMVELGAYLFTQGFYREAGVIFAETRQLPVASYEKSKIRGYWKDDNDQVRVFSGIVKTIRGARAFALAIPENFDAFFWRTQSNLIDLRENDPIRFGIGFNAHGAVARIIS